MTKKNNDDGDGDDVKRIRKCEEEEKEDKGDNGIRREVKTDTKVRFHQHFLRCFYKHRSQKRKKD